MITLLLSAVLRILGIANIRSITEVRKTSVPYFHLHIANDENILDRKEKKMKIIPT